MARLSKESWNVFEHNMNKAWGLVKLQFYGDDLIRTGGKESIGKLMEFTGQMFKSFGITEHGNLQEIIEDEIAPIIERELVPKWERRFQLVPPEQIEEASKEWLKKNEATLKQFEKVMKQLILAIENVLLEQAMVSAVTALEVYIHDVTTEVVSKNVFMQKRFTSKFHEDLDYKRILDSNRDLGKALGRVAAESYEYYNPKSLRKHLAILLGKNAPLDSRAELVRFETILAFRHLIVHRAGIVDQTFANQTNCRNVIGKPVRISRQFVEQTLDFIHIVGEAVQGGLSSQRA